MVVIGLYDKQGLLFVDNVLVNIDLCNAKQIVFIVSVLRQCLDKYMSSERIWKKLINIPDDDVDSMKLWTNRIIACWDEWSREKILPNINLFLIDDHILWAYVINNSHGVYIE